jgi:hypothetical protein
VRPVLGAVVGVVITAGFVWVVMQTRGRVLSVPHLAMLAALAMSVVGAVLGVLLGYMLSRANTGLPQSLGEAHPAAMVVGFLVPVGMGFIEWSLDEESVQRRANLAGWLQIGLPFLGGVLAVIGLLSGAVPLVALGIPFEIIGLVILVVRLRGPLTSTSLLAATPARHGVMALIFLVVNLAILVYLVMNYIAQNLQPPTPLLLALDHSIFVGVMTNGIITLIARFRGPVKPLSQHIAFWGLNIGAAGFVVALLLESTPLKQVFTPILGLTLLHAIAVLFIALGRGTEAQGART